MTTRHAGAGLPAPRPREELALDDLKIRLLGIPFFGVVIPNLTGLFGALGPGDLAYWLGYAWFVGVVFGFGLLHGLGFAGVLTEIGWPADRKVVALLAFNAGVELGQLAVIGAALLVLAASSRMNVPRRGVARVLSGAIAVVALVWTVQRVL